MFIQWIKFCYIKSGKVNSEQGFTLVELVFVLVLMGFLSYSLIMPFFSSLQRGTMGDINATAAQIASADIEDMRGQGFGSVALGNSTGTDIVINGRTYERAYTNTMVGDYIYVVATVTETTSNPDVEARLYAIISRDYN